LVASAEPDPVPSLQPRRRRLRRRPQPRRAGRAAAILDLFSGRPRPIPAVTRYRAIFISDVHLGSLGCKGSLLRRFLEFSHAEQLYLVGDIIDVWMTRRRQRWTEEQAGVMQSVMDQAGSGAQVYYLLGNHDALLGHILGASLGNIHIVDQCIHATADGHRWLVTHGHHHDRFATRYAWVCRAAAHVYYYVTILHNWLNRGRAKRNREAVELCRFVRERSKRFALRFTRSYEPQLVRDARRAGCQGVIYGHTHAPAAGEVEGSPCINIGDWVEHCTALVEHLDGRMELLWLGADGSASRATAPPHC
jgi:UDP-2,3-diacylglucosamine pyrophosphatase LpxH